MNNGVFFLIEINQLINAGGTKFFRKKPPHIVNIIIIDSGKNR